MRLYRFRSLLEMPDPPPPPTIGLRGVTDPSPTVTAWIEPNAWKLLLDVRAATLLESWLDTIVRVHGPERRREFSSLWHDLNAWHQDLNSSSLGIVRNVESRLWRCLLHVAGVMDDGPGYLDATWRWMLAKPGPSHPAATSSIDSVSSCRLERWSDQQLLATVATALLDHHVITPQHLEAALTQAGHTRVVRQLSERLTPTSDTTANDLLTAAAAARLMGITPATLANKKARGELPEECYVAGSGRRVRYVRDALMRWRKGTR